MSSAVTAARTLGDGNGLVFSMRSGRLIAASELPKMLQCREVAAVPHGLRSSFRDCAAEETDGGCVAAKSASQARNAGGRHRSLGSATM